MGGHFWFSGPPNVFEKEHFGQKLLVHFQFRFLLKIIMIYMLINHYDDCDDNCDNNENDNDDNYDTDCDDDCNDDDEDRPLPSPSHNHNGNEIMRMIAISDFF